MKTVEKQKTEQTKEFRLLGQGPGPRHQPCPQILPPFLICLHCPSNQHFNRNSRARAPLPNLQIDAQTSKLLCAYPCIDMHTEGKTEALNECQTKDKFFRDKSH